MAQRRPPRSPNHSCPYSITPFHPVHYGSKWFKSGQNLKNMKVFNIYFFMHFWWEEFLYFQDLQFFLMKLSFSHCKSWFNLKNICIIKHIWKTKDLWVYRKLFTTPSFLFLGTKYLVHKLFYIVLCKKIIKIYILLK